MKWFDELLLWVGIMFVSMAPMWIPFALFGALEENYFLTLHPLVQYFSVIGLISIIIVDTYIVHRLLNKIIGSLIIALEI